MTTKKDNQKKKPVAVLSTLGLATLIFGTSIASPYAHAAEGDNDNTNKQAEGSSSDAKGIDVKVSDQKLQDALDKAKKAGLDVKKDADVNKTASVKDSDKAKKEIQADYDKQAKDIEAAATKYGPEKEKYDKAMADYKEKKEAYDKARENPKFQGGKTEFSEDQLRKFLGDTPANVTYISGNTGKKDMKYTNDNLKPLSKSEFSKFKEGLTDEASSKYDNPESDDYIFTKIDKGSTWTYKNAINDGKTGHDVNVKVTVEDVKMQKGHENDPKIARVNKNSIGINEYVPIKEVKFKYDYIDAETGKPIKIDALMGKGDIDGNQYFKLDTKMDSVLKGSKVVQKGDQFWAAQDKTVYDSNDPSTQVWTISRGVDSQTFTYGAELDEEDQAKMEKGVHFSDYFVDGAIEFGLDIPPIPKEPTKPEMPDVKYHMNNLKVTPENHKDVENGTVKSDTEKSIEGKEVKVGDTITYPLTNSALPADREKDLTKYVVTDDVPKEVEPNEKEIKANLDTKLWDVKVDGQKVTYTATKDLLADMNKDKSKEFKVSDLPLVGTVKVADDTEFENTFTTTIGDKDGDIDVKSNTVKNKTPKPIESKVHKYIIDNGKLVENNEVKKGDKLSYQGDVQFSNKQAKERTISDQLDKERVDLDDVKVYETSGQDDEKEKSDDNSTATNDASSKDDDSKATDSDKSSTNEDTKATDDKTSNDNKSDSDDAKADDKTSDSDKATTDEDNKATDDKTSDATNTEATDNKDTDAEQQAGEETKSDDSKSDDSKATSEDKTNDDSATDSEDKDATSTSDSESGQTPFDTKSGKDITDQGTLKLDKDNESFTWTAKDASKFSGKKVTVVIDSTVKKDAKGDINNVINMSEDNDKKDSNKVVSKLKEDPKKEETPPAKDTPKKEDPKTPEKETPESPKESQVTPDQPQEKEQPKSTIQKVDKDLPSTGSDVGDFSIIGSILAALGLGSYAAYRHNQKRKAE